MKEDKNLLEIVTKTTIDNKTLIQFGIVIGLLAIAFISASNSVPVIGTNGTTHNITIQENVVYFLHNQSTNNTNISNSTYTPYLSKEMLEEFHADALVSNITITDVANGNTSIGNWTSLPMGITHITHGVHGLHIHALKIGVGGSHIDKIFYECGFVNSTGGNLTIRGTSEFSQEIPATLPYTEVDIDLIMPDVALNSTDRMFMRVWVNQTGTGANPTIVIFYEDLTDSRLVFPVLEQLQYKNGLLVNEINI